MKFSSQFCRCAAPLVLLVVLRLATPAFGQSANDGFDPNANGRIETIAVQSDGKILIGGFFTSVGGTNRGGLARLNVDGTLDPTFNPPPGMGTGFAPVEALAVQQDGMILVGGYFKTPHSYHLTRLHGDGSEDTNFLGNANNTVRSLLALPDGRILVGGYFNLLSGQPRTGIGRLNADGSLDSSFNAMANFGVLAMQRQPDGRLVVSGQFNMMGGMQRNNLARLNADGSLDGSFDPGAILNPSPNDNVFTLAVQPDGHILAGGYFAITNQPVRRNLLRFHPDGTSDNAFPIITNGPVSSVALQADGRIVVGGSAAQGGGLTPLGRLNPDGSVDASFRPSVTNGTFTGGEVSSVGIQADGKILVGGNFTNLAGQARNNIGRLYPGGRLDATLNPGASLHPYEVAVQPDGKILVAGELATLGGQARQNIGRLDPDGSLDTAFNPGANDTVITVAVQRDAKILIGGYFTSVGGQPRTNIARLNSDGSLDSTFNPGANFTVLRLALQPDDKIVVGGVFTMLGGQSRTNIGRLNADGSLDAGFNPGADSLVHGLVVQPDGKILVAGFFAMLSGQPRTNIARLNPDGSLDSAFSAVVNRDPSPFVLQADGKILITGPFTMVNGQPRTNIARLNADGSLDNTFNHVARDTVFSPVVQADGKILLAEAEVTNSQYQVVIRRLNPDGSVDENFSAVADGGICNMAVQSDGKILAVGDFTMLAGQPRSRIGRLTSGSVAQQRLATDATGTTVTWSRSGALPEVQPVTFEESADGTNYVLLGQATRISGGWELTGLSLPVGRNFYLRGRGLTTVASLNGSGLIESVAQFYRLAPPFLSVPTVLSNGTFQFTFTNTSATAFAVLATTNLASPSPDWEVLGQPTLLSNGVYQFTDPAGRNSPQRFYQLRSP